MHYVMSDLHGCFNEYIAMLEKINFSDDDLLYVIGDVLDRGEDSMKIILHMSKHPNIKLIKGNHEDMFLKAFDDAVSKGESWLLNGGETTLMEYLDLEDDLKTKVHTYLKNSVYYQELNINKKKYLLVHAGFDTEKINKIEDVSIRDLLWYRGMVNLKPFKDYTLIVGHIPTYSASFSLSEQYANQKKSAVVLKAIEDGGSSNIMHLDGVIYIDCGLVFNHKLGCLRLEDLQEFYIEKEQICKEQN